MRSAGPAILLLFVSLGALRVTVSGLQSVSMGTDARAAVTQVLHVARDLQAGASSGVGFQRLAESVGGELCGPPETEGPDHATLLVVPLSAEGHRTATRYGVIRFAGRTIVGVRVADHRGCPGESPQFDPSERFSESFSGSR